MPDGQLVPCLLFVRIATLAQKATPQTVAALSVIRKENMSYSFDIKTSVDLYNELLRRVDEYNKDYMSSGSAVICAILCWHVVEWIYQEYSEQLTEHQTNREFQESVKSRCVSLSYMQDIANGSKHRGITRYKPTVKKTESHNGSFSNDFSKAFDISCLKMSLENNQVVYFDEEIEKSVNFIKLLLNNELNEKV
ncbi:MAG: hypothetical protein ACJAUP_003778 [Cellvibrionaceae bacterium]